ncbi:hypothetical protein HHK36_026081 [Tetracentron sinense]|uniref:SLC26A/SulP transporter domain-containing protein n=1 Tax=Tetracentron sinense TaxID=13715 RepID=A0A835D456_TETSI|nr:hypothetical protein HHK36_026081 [Tetracentron sinense]
MGSSRDIAIGPVAVVSLLLGTLLQSEIDPADKDGYKRLAFTATFFAGITKFTLGFLRLGFLIDFLSHAAIVGFMAGATITIALQRLKGFLGIRNFTKKTDIVSVMRSVWGSQFIMGVSKKKNCAHDRLLLTCLLVVQLLSTNSCEAFDSCLQKALMALQLHRLVVFHKWLIRKLLWFFSHTHHGSIAEQVMLLENIGTSVLVAENQVRYVEKGINPPSVNEIYFTGDYLVKRFRIGIVVGMVALTEAVAIGRTFASMKDYQVDGNKELVALGAMNVIGSMASCYVATGSFSRSAVNYMAGCQTAVFNIVMSFVIFLTLKFFMPLFKYTPNAILSSIIISAVIGLIDFEAAILIWKIDKFDSVACMGAFIGVIFAFVEMGLLIAVRSLLHLVY